jgi:hypothetical protein
LIELGAGELANDLDSDLIGFLQLMLTTDCGQTLSPTESDCRVAGHRRACGAHVAGLADALLARRNEGRCSL